MNELPSAEFRKQYTKLSEKTAVTVNGHIIGVWMPGHASEVFTYKPPAGSSTAQAQRDELLRRINRRG